MLKRMGEWWGYLGVEPDPSGSRPKPPRSAWLARPTRAGRQAQVVWEPLADLIDARWRGRFGHDVIEKLRSSLWTLVSQLTARLPDYVPVAEQSHAWRADLRMPHPPIRDDRSPADLTLSALVSKLLLTFAHEFERESDLSLALSANVLRTLDDVGTPVRDLPRVTGVAAMGIDNALSILQQRRFAVVAPDPAGRRLRVAKLTPQGHEAQHAYRQRVAEVEERWQERCGEESVRALVDSLERVVGQPTSRQAPLLRGMKACPGGWRSDVPRPQTLPHFPMISHRGGFPDGRPESEPRRRLAPGTRSGGRRTQRRRDHRRRLEGDAMSRPRHLQQLGVGNQLGHSPVDGDMAPVALADDEHRGHAQLSQPAPDRLHHAGTQAAQGGGKSRRRVAQTIGMGGLRDLRPLVAKQRAARPLAREALDADVLDACGQLLVGRASRVALDRIDDARRGSDEHQAADPIWVAQGEQQGYAPSERVPADIHPLARGRGQAVDARREGDRTLIAVGTVTREVGRQDIAPGPRAGTEDPVPRAVGLGEAVKQQQRTHSLAPILPDCRHAMMGRCRRRHPPISCSRRWSTS